MGTRLCKRDVMGGLAGLQGREWGDQSVLGTVLGVKLTRQGLLTKGGAVLREQQVEIEMSS